MTDEVNNTDHVVAMQIICWETSGPGSHVDATFTRTPPPLATHWDNAPSHTAKMLQKGLRNMARPPESPDHTPIEHPQDVP